MKISAITAFAFSSMAAANYWTAEFYHSDDCSGSNPFQIGDEGVYGCNKAPNGGAWHSVKSGPNHGDWRIYFYESDDCTGGKGEHLSTENTCLKTGISGTGAYSSFKVEKG